jgi:hypothetical protein
VFDSNQKKLNKNVRTIILSEAQNSFFKGISINVPEFFEDPAFMAWLNNPDNDVFTWNTKGDELGEFSHVVLKLEGSLNGDGSDPGMPEHCWDLILEVVRQKLGEDRRPNMRYHVTLTNYFDGWPSAQSHQTL